MISCMDVHRFSYAIWVDLASCPAGSEPDTRGQIAKVLTSDANVSS